MEKPYTSFSVLVFLVAIGITTISVDSGKVQRDRNRVIHRTEDISGDGRYILEWEVNFNTEIITFEVTVETIGFVGFGISPFGGMLQADIVVGGVFPNGTTYFTDRYGSGASSMPREDAQQNWALVSGSETATHTTLKFYRLLDTGDAAEDVVITSNAGAVIWSYGTRDVLEYHHANRASVELDLLAPE